MNLASAHRQESAGGGEQLDRESSTLPGNAKSGVIWACFAAGFALSAIEAARWLGLRNYHGVEYYLVTGGLALGASGLIGIVAKILRLNRAVGLSLWTACSVALVAGPVGGLTVGLATLFALRLSRRSESEAPGAVMEGCAVGAAVCLVLLKGGSLGHIYPIFSNSLVCALIGGVAMVMFLYLLPLVLVRFQGPLRSTAWAMIPVLFAGWFALEPWTHRVSGVHRQPPPGFAQRRPVPQAGTERPGVLLIVLDTLRADRLSVYGYGRETTPELERLLKERQNAVAYQTAYSNGTWTVPSHASLFTGLMPNKHGAHFALDGSLRTRFSLFEGAPHLAQLMQEQGYATLGAYANYWLRVVGRIGDGFDVFFRVISFEPLPFLGEALRNDLIPGLCIEATKGGSRAAMVNRSILDLIRSWDARVDNPLFVFANYGDTHGPYAPPKPYRGTFYPTSLRERAQHLALDQDADERERLSGRYDEELLYLDHELGSLMDQLDQIGFLDHAWVFITSDHGEAFGEHGITEHGTTVHQEVVHVPLLVFPPTGVHLDNVDEPVSLIDVSATIAAIGGTHIEGSRGRDLRSLQAGSSVASVEFYGDAAKAEIHGSDAGLPQRTVISGNWKLLELGFEGATRVMLFDLAQDPGEEHDVAEANRDRVEELMLQLPPYGEPARNLRRVDDKAIDQLEDMGYSGDKQAASKPADRDQGAPAGDLGAH